MTAQRAQKYPGKRQEADDVLQRKADDILAACIHCPKCREECAFLEKYGSPAEMAETGDFRDPAFLLVSYECSLCGLCQAVCPVDVNPAALFLEMRRAAVRAGAGPLKPHRKLLAYEKRGISPRYGLYRIPSGCDTVFFPGCTASGTRPGQVEALYAHLQKSDPAMGIVLNCCSKPSHDLGCQAQFLSRFGELRSRLIENGIRRVIVACPNCYQVFSAYGGPLESETVYERLLQTGLPGRIQSIQNKDKPLITIHDPCVLRDTPRIQKTIRQLAEKTGFEVVEMAHTGRKTLCCGEGGAVGLIDARLPQKWQNRRKQEAGGIRMATYCAGCAAALQTRPATIHILDAIFAPENARAGRSLWGRAARPPRTYWNRLRLKKHLKRKAHKKGGITQDPTGIVKP